MLENNPNQPADDLGTPLKVVSFCIPLVGAILYFTTDRQAYPNKAKQACTFALYGLGVGILIQIIMTVAGLGAGVMGR